MAEVSVEVLPLMNVGHAGCRGVLRFKIELREDRSLVAVALCDFCHELVTGPPITRELAQRAGIIQ